MIKIKEINKYNDASYIIQTINNQHIIDEYEVRCKSTRITKQGKVYYLLFDRNYNLIISVFEYINVHLDNLKNSPQTKDKTLIALKLLYSYLNIFNFQLEEMTSSETSNLLTFLYGYSQEGNDISLSFSSIKESSSVNDYLSIMRSYIKYLNLKNHPLLRILNGRKIVENIFFGEVNNYSSYELKAKEYNRIQIPKHISLEEYKLILDYIHKSKNKQLECIVRLMYEHGMRSGEVLGLTLEDLKMSIEDNNTYVYKLILRNRISNKSWQSPKLLMKTKSKSDYMLKDYMQRGYGFEYVYITKSMYELLLVSIDKTNSIQKDKHSSNWHKFCVTDSVDIEFDEECNFYMFVNSIGRPLSKKTLDNDIKALFSIVGVKLTVDGGKYDGLCHRFRHGFAMYQINYNKTPILLLKELMRHRSLKSTAIYYTPETSTIIKIKDEMSRNVYEYIPEFSLTR